VDAACGQFGSRGGENCHEGVYGWCVLIIYIDLSINRLMLRNVHLQISVININVGLDMVEGLSNLY